MTFQVIKRLMTPHQRDVPSLRDLAKPTSANIFSLVSPCIVEMPHTDGLPMIFSFLVGVDMLVG
jgi:hypothetical protein